MTHPANLHPTPGYLAGHHDGELDARAGAQSILTPDPRRALGLVPDDYAEGYARGYELGLEVRAAARWTLERLAIGPLSRSELDARIPAWLEPQLDAALHDLLDRGEARCLDNLWHHVSLRARHPLLRTRRIP